MAPMVVACGFVLLGFVKNLPRLLHSAGELPASRDVCLRHYPAAWLPPLLWLTVLLFPKAGLWHRPPWGRITGVGMGLCWYGWLIGHTDRQGVLNPAVALQDAVSGLTHAPLAYAPLLVAFVAVSVVAALGLWTLRPWGRQLALLLSVIAMLITANAVLWDVRFKLEKLRHPARAVFYDTNLVRPAVFGGIFLLWFAGSAWYLSRAHVRRRFGAGVSFHYPLVLFRGLSDAIEWLPDGVARLGAWFRRAAQTPGGQAALFYLGVMLMPYAPAVGVAASRLRDEELPVFVMSLCVPPVVIGIFAAAATARLALDCRRGREAFGAGVLGQAVVAPPTAVVMSFAAAALDPIGTEIGDRLAQVFFLPFYYLYPLTVVVLSLTWLVQVIAGGLSGFFVWNRGRLRPELKPFTPR